MRRMKMKGAGFLLLGACAGVLVGGDIPVVAEAAPQARTTFTISAAGDCTLGKDVGSGGRTFPVVARHHRASWFLKKVQPVFATDDLTLVNCEGTLTKRGHRRAKTYAFRGKPSYARIFAQGSVEAVSVANNHCRDYGRVSASDTIKALRTYGVESAGYARVATFTRKGVKVGIIGTNVIGGEGYGDTVGTARRDIRRGTAKLKKAGCDLIVVYVHWGSEGAPRAEAAQRALAHYAVRKGADLVLGSHPHVLQGIERYRGVYICYSLANFCFGGNSNPADKDTMIFRQTFVFRNATLQKGESRRARIIPCSVSSVRGSNNFQPRRLGGSAGRRVIAKVRTRSTGRSVRISADGAVAPR